MTAPEQLEQILRAERWAGQDAQREFDRRVVLYAVQNGLDPVRAITSSVFVIGAEAVAACKLGLNL